MLVPLYGFLKGDTLGVIVLVQDGELVADVARILGEACAVRVAPPGPGVRSRVRVLSAGRSLDLEATVAAAGLTALDRVDVEVLVDGGGG